MGHKSVVSQDRWSLLTGSGVLKCKDLLHEISGLSRLVVFHLRGLSRQVSLYCDNSAPWGHAWKTLLSHQSYVGASFNPDY